MGVASDFSDHWPQENIACSCKFWDTGVFQAWRSSSLRMYLEKSDKSLPLKSSTILQIDLRLKLTLVKLLFTSNDSGSFPLLKTQHQPAWSSGSWLTWKEERSSLSHYWWTRSLWAHWAQTTSWQPFGPRRHWTLRACVTLSFAAFGGSGCVTHATVIG